MMTKFNVGDKVRILNVDSILGGKEHWDNGDIVTVTESQRKGLSDKTWLTRTKNAETSKLPFLHSFESKHVELVENKPKKSARITALESQVVALEAKVEALESAGKYPLTNRFNREAREVDAILADIERKAKPTLEALLATYPSPNEQRADVIKRAKAFVARANGRKIEYVVNSEKRTVVALFRSSRNDSVITKGIAKCDPDDVFNADIGKAIALARALGVEVPVEFVKAVQPTELVSGIIYELGSDSAKFRADNTTHRYAFAVDADITDDTDAVYECP